MGLNVGRDPQAETRTRRALDGVLVILNSLIDSGAIVLTGPSRYALARPPADVVLFEDNGGSNDLLSIPGPPGINGTTGAQGPTGPPLFLLEDGPPGADGIPGINGTNGTNGATGAQGPTGTPLFLLEDGPQGEEGIPGRIGSDGVAGATGAQGPTGTPLFLLEDGPPGEDGRPGFGTNGTNGIAGAQGPPGPATHFLVDSFGGDDVMLGFMSGPPTFASANLTGVVPNCLILLEDQKASGTQGGTFTSGAWQTRTLNTIVVDTSSICSLSSNQFTLPAGTYRLTARSPAFVTALHQTRLQNITDATTVAVGSCSFSTTASAVSTNDSVLNTRFTITASKTFELQHKCQTTRLTDGFGPAASLATEVYAQVEIQREAT